MTDDPFDPAADPYPADPPIARRGALRLALAAPIAALAAAGCRAPRDLVCAPVPGDAERCTARFCRYHEGG